MPNQIKNNYPYFIFFIIFIIQILIYGDYGLSWDEGFSRLNGIVSFNYIIDKINILESLKYEDAPNLNEYIDNEYGVFFELINIILEKIFDLNDSKDIFLSRHLLNSLIFLIAGIYFYYTLNQFYNKSISVLGFLIFFIHPRIFAQSFYNSKDIIFLSFFCISSFYFLKYFITKNIKFLFILCFFISITIGTRVMGLIIPLLFIFFFIMENLESNKYKNIYLLAPFLILTIGLTILFWPFLWENPLNILLSIKSMSSYALDGLVYFEDNYYPGKFLPWYYLPKIIIITSPLLYLILFIYGFLIITKNLYKNLLNLKNNNLWNNFEELYCFYSIIIIFSTIIIITELNSTIYNGWRQIYFIYPSIIFICVYGLNKLLKFKNYKNPIFILLFIGIIYIIGWNYQNHPHQYVYYNLLINKKNIRNYELDYWGVSNLEILKKISEIENYKNKNIFIFSESPYQYSLKMIEKNKVENFNFVNNINNADLIITNHYYQSKDPKIEEKYLKSNFKLIYEIRSNNVRINSIYKKK